MNTQLLWPFFLIGLSVGGVYALLGAGVILAYRASGFLHIAHAGIAMTSAMTYAWIGRLMPVGIAALICIGLGAANAALLYRFVFSRVEQESMTAKVVVSVATGIGLQSVGGAILVNAGFLNGAAKAGSLFPEDVRFSIFGATTNPQKLALPIVAIIVVVGLQLILTKTDLGLALRASAQNPGSAAFAGLPSNRVTTLAWTASGALAGVAGVLSFSGAIGLIAPTYLFAETVRGLAASLAGGFTDFRKMAAAAFALGILEQQLVGFDPPWNSLRGALSFGLITLVALFGLSRTGERALA